MQLFQYRIDAAWMVLLAPTDKQEKAQDPLHLHIPAYLHQTVSDSLAEVQQSGLGLG